MRVLVHYDEVERDARRVEQEVEKDVRKAGAAIIAEVRRRCKLDPSFLKAHGFKLWWWKMIALLST